MPVWNNWLHIWSWEDLEVLLQLILGTARWSSFCGLMDHCQCWVDDLLIPHQRFQPNHKGRLDLGFPCKSNRKDIKPNVEPEPQTQACEPELNLHMMHPTLWCLSNTLFQCDGLFKLSEMPSTSSTLLVLALTIPGERIFNLTNLFLCKKKWRDRNQDRISFFFFLSGLRRLQCQLIELIVHNCTTWKEINLAKCGACK